MSEYIPEGQTILFEGPQRRGKTLAGVLYALNAHQKGRNVFSNIHLEFPHKPLEFWDLELEDGSRRYWNGHIFIDELNFFFDSRASMSKANKQFAAYLLQQKKQGCNLTGTTHNLSYLDVRLRQNYDYIIRPSVYPEYPETPKTLTLHIENGPLQRHLSRKVQINIEPFLGLYDSFQVYDPFKVPDKPVKTKPTSRAKL